MRIVRSMLALVLALTMVCGMACAEDLTDVIVNPRTTQAFSDEAVSDEDLNTILEAGLAATSAINQQPWFFAVVTNQDVIADIKASAGGFPGAGAKPAGAPAGAPKSGAKAGLGDSPVAIIIYMNEATASPNASFDCGLACQNMFIAAKALGYGVKIVSSPTMQLNGDDHDKLCGELGVDASYSAVAVLLVGREDTSVDGYTSASVRDGIEEKVSFVK